jgi:mannose-6-phosphate isomerase-like protein (cupin superfamily)
MRAKPCPLLSADRRPAGVPPALAALLGLIGLVDCKNPTPAPAPDAGGSAAQAPTPASSSPPPKLAPIDGALPSAAPHPLDRRAECPKESCTLAHLVPDEVRPALSDGAPMTIWEQGIGERASLVFPRDEGVELMGVVLDGNLDLTPMEAPTARSVGGRWAAFRAPGGGVTLGGTGGKALRVALVVAVARGKKGGEPLTPALAAHLDERDRPGAPPAWSWKVRRKPIETFSFSDRPDLAWGGGAYHARIGWEPGDQPAAVVDLLRLSPDAGIAEHIHDHEWESLAALEGDGALVRKGGDERVEVRPGTIVTIPAGMRHAWKPSGKAPLLAIQVYAPPGPEQRFKKLAGKPP